MADADKGEELDVRTQGVNAPGGATEQETLPPDWKREYDSWNDQRFEKLEARIRRLERANKIIEWLNDPQKLYMIALGGYLLFQVAAVIFESAREGRKIE